jgi:hypothetical protein
VTNFHKVPASGEAVNDGRQTALSRGGPGQAVLDAGVGVEFNPGLVRIPTKRRFFFVYQKGSADITIAGAATES